MKSLRFSNFFRSVTLDLSDEAVSLIREGRHPRTVLSRDEVTTVTGRLAKGRPDWSMIFVFESDGTLLWTEPARPARYMRNTRHQNA